MTGLQGTTYAGGQIPRDFQFTPSGGHVFVANQESSLITVFKWNEDSGALDPVGEGLPVHRPTCVLFP